MFCLVSHLESVVVGLLVEWPVLRNSLASLAVEWLPPDQLLSFVALMFAVRRDRSATAECAGAAAVRLAEIRLAAHCC